MIRSCRLVITCWLVAILLMGGCSPRTPAKKFRIAVIPKGTTHVFWQSIHAGALKAAKEHGDVEIVWQGPSREDQSQEQQNIVQRFATEGVSAIVLAPLDRQTLVAPVDSALKKGIRIVIIDSGLEESPAMTENKNYLGYVATDNEEGGRKAAQRMVELLKGKAKAKVLMLPYQAGSQSTELREKGFKEELAKHKQIELIVSNKEAGATVESAQKASEQLLPDYPMLDGIFAPNESSTVGMLRALEAFGRAGKVKLVGFDSSPDLITALKAGNIDGLVIQDPFDMGYKAVQRALADLEGTPPTNRTLHTNLRIVTNDNLQDADIQAMIRPDLSGIK